MNERLSGSQPHRVVKVRSRQFRQPRSDFGECDGDHGEHVVRVQLISPLRRGQCLGAALPPGRDGQQHGLECVGVAIVAIDLDRLHGR